MTHCARCGFEACNIVLKYLDLQIVHHKAWGNHQWMHPDQKNTWKEIVVALCIQNQDFLRQRALIFLGDMRQAKPLSLKKEELRQCQFSCFKTACLPFVSGALHDGNWKKLGLHLSHLSPSTFGLQVQTPSSSHPFPSEPFSSHPHSEKKLHISH